MTTPDPALLDPEIHPSVLEWLIERADPALRLAVASHPDTPAATLERLAAGPDRVSAEAAALHVRLAGEIASSEAASTEIDGAVDRALGAAFLGANLERIAEVITLGAPIPPVLLNEWVPLDQVRAAVGSEHQPLAWRHDLLARLATESAPDARAFAAAHPETPDDVLARLRADEDPSVRAVIEARRRTLATNEDAAIQQRLTAWIESDVPFFRLVALLHPLAPREALERGARSAAWLDRWGVARNPAAPDALLDSLATDPNRIVRACARARRRTSEEAQHD